MTKFRPATEALALRIWAFAHPIGWNCDIAEIGAALAEPPRRIGIVCTLKGWTGRLRASPSAAAHQHWRDGPRSMEGELDIGMCGLERVMGGVEIE